MADEVEANTVDLTEFAERGEGYVAELQTIFDDLAAFRSIVNQVLGAGTPTARVANPSSGTDPFGELIAETTVNNGFVATIHDALQAYSHDSGTTVTAPASVVGRALRNAALAELGTDMSYDDDRLGAFLATASDEERRAILDGDLADDVILDIADGRYGDDARDALLAGQYHRVNVLLLDNPETEAAVLLHEAMGMLDNGTVSFDELGDLINGSEDDLINWHISQGRSRAEAEALYAELLSSMAFLAADDRARARFDGANDDDSTEGNPDIDDRFTVADAEAWALARAQSSDAVSAQGFRLDIYVDRIEDGRLIDLRYVATDDQIAVADLIIDHHVGSAVDAGDNSPQFTQAMLRLDAVNQQANQIGGELRSHVGNRFIETAIDIEAAIDRADDTEQSSQKVATALANQGVALLTIDEQRALVARLEGDLVSSNYDVVPALQVLVDALDLDGDEVSAYAGTFQQTQLGCLWRIEAADRLLAATQNDDGTLSPGGSRLFDLVITDIMDSGRDTTVTGDMLQPTGRYDDGAIRGFDFHQTLLRSAGAPQLRVDRRPLPTDGRTR